MSREAAASRLYHRPLRTLSLLVLVAAVLTAGAPSLIRIRPGDTLSGLAGQRHTSVAVLQALNHLGGSTLIYAGATLRVPGAPAARAIPRPAPVVVVRSYTVRPGEGLITVAHRLRTTPTALMRLNRLRRNYLLLGEHLRYTVRVVASAPASLVEPHGGNSSAARHRALLASRHLPSTAAVRAMIVRAARRQGVPVSLALAISWQESGFQQRVVSGIDAIGAMQVLPSTGASLGELHGRHFDLLKASDNIEAGVLLLRDLLQATGRIDKAVAGYYQGLGSIGRIGVLPETTQYVRNVTTLQRLFR